MINAIAYVTYLSFPPPPLRSFTGTPADADQDEDEEDGFGNSLDECVACGMRSTVDSVDVSNDKRNESNENDPTLPRCGYPAPSIRFGAKPIRALRVVCHRTCSLIKIFYCHTPSEAQLVVVCDDSLDRLDDSVS